MSKLKNTVTLNNASDKQPTGLTTLTLVPGLEKNLGFLEKAFRFLGFFKRFFKVFKVSVYK